MSAKKIRAALKEAVDLYEHDYCYNDGRIIIIDDTPSIGAQWLMSAREALGLDPITGKRKPRKQAKDVSS